MIHSNKNFIFKSTVEQTIKRFEKIRKREKSHNSRKALATVEEKAHTLNVVQSLVENWRLS